MTGKKTLMAYNTLVGRYDGADGMKTGFVCSSGFNMIGSASRNGRTLTAVVLGEGSAVKRTEMVAMLLDYGFGTTGGQTETLGTLRATARPTGRRPICAGDLGGSRSAQSEDAARHQASVTMAQGVAVTMARQDT
jgi:D-alanyl-D-alanine carboxypeptidase